MSDKAANGKAREPFRIKGADGRTIEVKYGEYYFNTKARGRRMMQNSLSGHARQVYACLELATMGFLQELAVIRENGKTRELAPIDISKQTGLSDQNVRRALAELEDAGLAKRESDDGGPLRHGHVRIYSWAEPWPPAKPDKLVARDYFPEWFPESWEPLKPLIKRLKLSFSIDEVVAPDYLEEGAQAARDYQKAEKVVLEFLPEGLRAPLF